MRLRTTTTAVCLPFVFSALCATLWSRPMPARADSSADEAEIRFLRGTAHYKAGRYEEALGDFFMSNRLAPNRNVVFNIARSYEALHRYEESYRYYVEYLAAESSPDERRVAEQKLQELAPRVALLRIESTPPGATVYLDRRDLGGRGQTPLLIAQAPGAHQVILELEGHHPLTLPANLKRGHEERVSGTLDLIVGTIRITSTPAARVFVNRAAGALRPPDATNTPTVLRLPPGRHSLELEAPGYRARRSDAIVRAGVETKVEISLEPLPPPSGTVVLASSVQGAMVFVDGVQRGFTPAVLDLVAGDHAIEVRGEGYVPWRRTVRVLQDSREFYQIDLDDLESEVTGATRTQQSVSSAPASITLITRDEMWAFGHEKLTDALRTVRGFYTSDDLNYESIGVRGFSRPGDYTNRILVSRDGHTTNDDWIGSAQVGRDMAVGLHDVSRVEVVRGPGSSFYGPGAFFGVVNIVSQSPTEGPHARASAGLSSDGGGSVFAHGRTTQGPIAVSVHASAFDSTGRTRQFDEFADTPSGGEVRGADAENAQRGALRLRAGDFQVDVSFSRRLKEIPTASYATVFDPAHNMATGQVTTHTIDRRGFAEARWDHKRDRLRLSARVAYDYQQYDGVYPYDDQGEAFIFSDAGGGDWLTGELRAAFRLGNQWLTVGGDVAGHRVIQSFDEDNDGLSEFEDPHEFVNGSIYIVDEVVFSKRLAVTGGARLDRFGEQRDAAISPRVGVVIRPYGDAVTKLVAGRAFRSPSVYELYYNDGGITQVAPDELRPETIWTGEIEHTHAFGRRSYVLGSVFANRIRDLIALHANEDDVLVFENSAGEVRTAGAEAEVRVAGKEGGWAGAALSYTHLRADDPAVKVNSTAVVGSVRGYLPISKDTLAIASEFAYNAPRNLRNGRQTGHTLIGSLFLSGRLPGRHLRYRTGVSNALDWDGRAAVGEEFLQQSIPQTPRTVWAQLVYEAD
jgi:outer membrane receptor for ferrienterochelin and colicins